MNFFNDVWFNKRGQIFILIFVVIISFLFLTFETYSFVYEKNSVKNRVSTMNSFLDSIEKNLERQLYIVGYRIIFLAQTEIARSGDYVDFDEFFSEAFFNGTVNGEENNTFLTGVTYDDFIDSINEKAKKINVEINLSNTVINISQDSPWSVKFEMISDFSMTDMENLSRWDKKQYIVAYVPIVGFEDPFYTINSNAKVSRKIKKTIYEGNYTNFSDVSNLYSHVENNYYAANSNAPGFLNRLEGNFSANENGIESFVDVSEFSSQGLFVKEKSRVDYIYFSNLNPNYYRVGGMQSWFLIDNSSNRLEKYGVLGLTL